jgi:hypothetical protein
MRKMEVGGRQHAPAALPPGKGLGTHCIGGWVGPRAGLTGRRKSRPPPGFFFRSPDRPARSQSLNRLSYPGPLSRNVPKFFPVGNFAPFVTEFSVLNRL